MTPKYYKELIKNRRAFHDFVFQEAFKAGLVLYGSEVKSVRLGRANFSDSFVRVDNNELWLYNMHVSPYEKGGTGFDPDRSRKLLVNKQELRKISAKIAEKGLVAIPLKLFLDGDWVKLEVGLGRAKKKFEKRETLKRKNMERDVERALREKKK